MTYAPGQSGNPAGKPVGARSRKSRLIEDIFTKNSEEIARRAVEIAMQGDPICLKLILDRTCPARRDRPIQFALPADLQADPAAMAMAVLCGVANGQVTPLEAASLAALIRFHAIGTTLDEGNPGGYILDVSLRGPPLMGRPASDEELAELDRDLNGDDPPVAEDAAEAQFESATSGDSAAPAHDMPAIRRRLE